MTDTIVLCSFFVLSWLDSVGDSCRASAPYEQYPKWVLWFGIHGPIRRRAWSIPETGWHYVKWARFYGLCLLALWLWQPASPWFYPLAVLSGWLGWRLSAMHKSMWIP